MGRARVAEVVARVAPGEVLEGKYRVERILGSGGMGVVVAARHLALRELVAIKFLRDEYAVDERLVARFLREARAAARIKSEHVARVFDVGTFDDGVPYMVMEHLAGADLAAHLEEQGPLPPEVAVDYVLQACEALAEAHACGIVHRDLKPANLFLTRRGDGTACIKVLDFGISKTDGAQGTSGVVTSHAAIVGSPIYMSPEQLTAPSDVDARADMFSLGIVLFELVAGRPPFSGETLPQLVAQILHAPAPLLRSVRPDAPPELEAVIARCLERDRTKRFADAAELAAELAKLAPDRARSPAKHAPLVVNAGDPRPRRPKWDTRLVAAVVAAVLAGAGVAAIGFRLAGPERAPAPAQAAETSRPVDPAPGAISASPQVAAPASETATPPSQAADAPPPAPPRRPAVVASPGPPPRLSPARAATEPPVPPPAPPKSVAQLPDDRN